MMTARAALAVLVAVAVAVAAPAAAGRKKKDGPRPLSEAPAWLRDAVARDTPAGAAGLAILHRELVVEPLAAGGVRSADRIAARILVPGALGDLDAWRVRYRQGDEVESLRGWAVADGAFRESDPELDMTDGPWMDAGTVFEDARRRTLSAPALRVGSVVAFESIVVKLLDPGGASFLFGHSERPTAYSRFEVILPTGWEHEVLRLRMDRAEVAEEPGRIEFVLRDLPPLPAVPFRPPKEDLLPQAWVRWWSPDGRRGYRDWDSVGRWYDDLSRPVLVEKGEAAEVGERLKPDGEEDLLAALEEAYDFAARQVRYVAIQIGIGGWKPSTPAVVCATRYGDCKDKTFLMRALLDGWQIETYPVLVRTRHLGPVVEDVPHPFQFNHCILGVRLPDGAGLDLWPVTPVEGLGRVLFVDPTVRSGSPWTLGEADQGTLALVVHGGGGELVRLPEEPPEHAVARRLLDAETDEHGNLRRAVLHETWSGRLATAMRDHYAGLDDAARRAELAEDLQDRFPRASLAEYRIDGLEDWGRPLVRRMDISGGLLGKRVGDLLILEPGRVAYGVLGTNLPPPPRKWELDIELPREESVEIAIRAPAGWIPEEIPAPFALDAPYLQAEARWSVEDGRLEYRRTVRSRGGRVKPDEYAAFRDALLGIEREDSRAVVFVRAPGDAGRR